MSTQSKSRKRLLPDEDQTVIDLTQDGPPNVSKRSKVTTSSPAIASSGPATVYPVEAASGPARMPGRPTSLPNPRDRCYIAWNRFWGGIYLDWPAAEDKKKDLIGGDAKGAKNEADARRQLADRGVRTVEICLPVPPSEEPTTSDTTGSDGGGGPSLDAVMSAFVERSNQASSRIHIDRLQDNIFSAINDNGGRMGDQQRDAVGAVVSHFVGEVEHLRRGLAETSAHARTVAMKNGMLLRENEELKRIYNEAWRHMSEDRRPSQE